MHFRTQRFLLAWVVSVIVFFSGGVSATTPLAADFYNYQILREGKPIGHYSFTVTYEGEEQHIKAEMAIKVKLAFITLYKAEYAAKSVYKHGALLRHEAAATYNGKDYTTYYNAQSMPEEITVNGTNISLAYVPFTFGPFAFNAEGYVNLLTEKGKVYTAQIHTLEEETLTIGGIGHVAQHVRISGEVERALWYGKDGTLLQARYDKDGAEILLIRK